MCSKNNFLQDYRAFSAKIYTDADQCSNEKSAYI